MRLIIIALIVITLSSCEDADSIKYGHKFDTTRAILGLPKLPKNWRIGNQGKANNGCHFVSWTNPNDTVTPPYFYSKTVLLNNDTIIYEENQYIGPDKYTTVDGTFDEELFITYYFDNYIQYDTFYKKTWKYSLRNEDALLKNIDKKVADSILYAWGIRY
jgi:hypothetical protein